MISLPAPVLPNLAVTLDVMQRTIHDKPINILLMSDAGNMMIHLKQLADESARTSLSAYFTHWISIFDRPVFTIVDHRRSLTNEYMALQLKHLPSELCAIPTETSWSIEINERSNGFIHRDIDKLQYSSIINCWNYIDILFAEAEESCNFIQYIDKVIPHFHHFGSMPHQIVHVHSDPTNRERIALVELARIQIE